MKYLKYGIGGLIILILALIIIVRVAFHEPRPQIIEGADANMKATKMLEAVNKAAWDTLPLVSWTFRGTHHFVWDKIENKSLVKWDDYVVHLNPDEINGMAYRNGELLKGKELQKAIKNAWSYWCNDMFWLAAPFKIRDKGVQLSIAKDKEGKEGLLVTYASGGVTPGDSYLWFMDETGLPTGYKMWVKIIPVGGIYTSWENWTTLSGGVKLAALHQGKQDFLKIEISNILGGSTWQELGYDTNPIKL